MKNSIVVFVLTVFLTVCGFGQSYSQMKEGSIVVIVDKTIVEINGCHESSDRTLILMDNSGTIISEKMVNGNSFKMETSDLNHGTTLILLSGDCVTKFNIK